MPQVLGLLSDARNLMREFPPPAHHAVGGLSFRSPANVCAPVPPPFARGLRVHG